MLERYRMCRRCGVYYVRDKVTGRGESLKTRDKIAAKQLVVARNQAVAQPQLNRSLARAYLSAKSPELLTRTWVDVMHHYVVTGVESTRERKERCFRSRPFVMLRTLKLIDTEGIKPGAVPQARRPSLSIMSMVGVSTAYDVEQ